MAGHFGNQVVGAPIDCEAISFLPLADLVGDLHFAAQVMLPLSIACSLNGHVRALTCQDRPSDPRKLVSQSHNHDIAVRPRKQPL